MLSATAVIGHECVFLFETFDDPCGGRKIEKPIVVVAFGGKDCIKNVPGNSLDKERFVCLCVFFVPGFELGLAWRNWQAGRPHSMASGEAQMATSWSHKVIMFELDGNLQITHGPLEHRKQTAAAAAAADGRSCAQKT